MTEDFPSSLPPEEIDATDSLSLLVPDAIAPAITIPVPSFADEPFPPVSDTAPEDSEDNPGMPIEPLPSIPIAEEEPQSKPFVVEMLRRDLTLSGRFRPESVVQISRSLRTSGLLATLPTEELQSLLALLTFTTPNGDCIATLWQLADTLNLSEAQMRQRIARLIAFRWQGELLVLSIATPEQAERYTPSPFLVAFVERPPTTEYAPSALQPRVAGRDAIIAYSRARYSRPRAEVEALIAKQMGWKTADPAPPENSPEREEWDLRQTLKALGVTKEQTDNLLAHYPKERVQRQLQWLPYRNARNQLSFLLAAIEGDYEMPLRLRQEQATFPTEKKTETQEMP